MIAVKLKDTSVRGIISLVYYDTAKYVLVGEAEVDLITNLKLLYFISYTVRSVVSFLPASISLIHVVYWHENTNCIIIWDISNSAFEILKGYFLVF